MVKTLASMKTIVQTPRTHVRSVQFQPQKVRVREPQSKLATETSHVGEL